MPWNPQQYNQFKETRQKPFWDLVALVQPQPGMQVLDLGCGTGELTAALLDVFPEATVSGIDSSEEMLAEAPRKEGLALVLRTIEEQLALSDTFDLIISNAALQWVDDHPMLFRKMIMRLNPGGQLAVQMPSQTENILNRLLVDLAEEEPYAQAMQGYVRRSSVLPIEAYAQLLFRNGGTDITVLQKIFPQVAESHEALYEFIAGSALEPYLERLEGRVKDAFIAEYQKRIETAFPEMPALYPFKRILLYARF